MPKTYYCTKKFVNMCTYLEEEAVKRIREWWPELSEDQAAYICPPISTFEKANIFAEPQDYDDKDIPNLEKMVELGLLESEEHEGG